MHPFKPIIFKDSHTLFLGTFPSIASHKQNFYYAHPRNQFWKILSAISGYPINNTDQKLWLLKECKFALWDTIQSCTQQSSLDSTLKHIIPNDIETLLKEYPSIQRVAFTSKLAQKIYTNYFAHLRVKTLYLPSPSPAYAAMSLDEKIEIYKTRLGSL